VIYSAFLSPAPKAATYPARARESFATAAPMVVLALGCVVLGLWPQLAMRNVLGPAIGGATTTGQNISAVAGEVRTGTLGLWNPTQATGLIFIGVLLGTALVWIATWRRKVRVVRPFLAGEVPAADDDRFRVPGTHFYETISKLPFVGVLLRHGEAGAMDPYHWAGKYGKTLVELLRAQHTGLLSLYVAWCLIGLTVTLIYLLLSAGI